MIDLSIDRDLEARLDQVRRLGREHLRPLGIEADRRREPVPPDHRFFALAWRMGIGQPLGVEEHPASGPRTWARRGVVLAEEMSYWDRGMSVAMPGLGLGGPPLLGMGTAEQKERFLAPFRDRERAHWAAFAMTEPGAGSDVAAIETTAVRDGDAWVLRGAKTFISNAMRADWIVVWATVDRAAGRAGHRAFIVERGTPGLEDMRPEHKMGLIAYERSSATRGSPPTATSRSSTATSRPWTSSRGRARSSAWSSRGGWSACRAREGLALLPAVGRQPGRRRARPGRAPRRPLPADARRAGRAGEARRYARLRLDQLHRASFPCRGL